MGVAKINDHILAATMAYGRVHHFSRLLSRTPNWSVLFEVVTAHHGERVGIQLNTNKNENKAASPFARTTCTARPVGCFTASHIEEPESCEQESSSDPQVCDNAKLQVDNMKKLCHLEEESANKTAPDWEQHVVKLCV